MPNTNQQSKTNKKKNACQNATKKDLCVLEAQEAAARQDDGDRRPRPLDALLADGQPLDEVEFSGHHGVMIRTEILRRVFPKTPSSKMITPQS
eukprot:2036013-Amphidinium_carterae.1